MSKIFKFIAKTLLALFILTVLWVVVYRFLPVPGTPLMLIRKISEGTPINHTWVPIEKISPDMAIAVFGWQNPFKGVLEPLSVVSAPRVVTEAFCEIEIQQAVSLHHLVQLEDPPDGRTFLNGTGQGIASRFELCYRYFFLGM